MPIVHPKTQLRIGNWNNDCVTALTWTPEGGRKRGRSKTTWWRTVEKERSKAGWQSWSEVRTAAQDRNQWKAHVDPMRHLGTRGQVIICLLIIAVLYICMLFS